MWGRDREVHVDERVAMGQGPRSVRWSSRPHDSRSDRGLHVYRAYPIHTIRSQLGCRCSWVDGSSSFKYARSMYSLCSSICDLGIATHNLNHRPFGVRTPPPCGRRCSVECMAKYKWQVSKSRKA